MTLLITLATTNANKMKELAEMANASAGLDIRFGLPDAMADIEETGSTFEEENALIKCRQTEPLGGSDWVLGEDSGLVVNALAGTYGIDPFPGLYSNRWLTHRRYAEIMGGSIDPDEPLTYGHKNHALQRLLDSRDKAKRGGAYVCAMALRNTRTGDVITVRGETRLEILQGPPRGAGGFGYDPVALAVELDPTRTMAELSPAEKNAISHRGRAFKKLLDAIANVGQC